MGLTVGQYPIVYIIFRSYSAINSTIVLLTIRRINNSKLTLGNNIVDEELIITTFCIIFIELMLSTVILIKIFFASNNN